ncbi:hypothetical protein [Glycomyces sp. NRRL B-16210]|uniref:hypothetical protein n=1 Tax=Glycomyces sp. NRRL B-16210 TaxID=1463821 RepID=UPI0004C0BF8E|nr:hypothetical protein [Glycomyces sp. NRRL B-16210]
MRPGEIRDRLDADQMGPVVVISSELFNFGMNRVLVAPLLATAGIAPSIPVKGGHLAFPLLLSLPLAALSDPRGRIDDADLEEVHGYLAGAMTR